MSKITIYSKAGCVFCDRLTQLLSVKEVEFKELKLGKDYNTEEFIAEFGPSSTFPQVKYGGKNIGGMKESLMYMQTHKLL